MSKTPTERARYPFEIITADFAEFEKRTESFLILGDKYSGALHISGMRKGGTTEEAIDAVHHFATSSTQFIKKIVVDRGSQFTSGALKEWAREQKIELQSALSNDQTQTNTQRVA